MISSKSANILRVAVCSLAILGVTCDYSGGAGYGGDYGSNNLGGYDSFSQGGGGGYGGGDGGYGGSSGGSYGGSSGGSYGGSSGGSYVGSTGGNYGGSEGHQEEEHHEAHPYEFGYAVKDPHHGTDFGQQESSDGHNVKGSYRVVLPDGRTQIVTYHADWKTGFHADVKYEGEAHYPEQSNNNYGGGDGGYNYPAQDISSSHNYPAQDISSSHNYPAQDISSSHNYGGGDHSFSGYSR